MNNSCCKSQVLVIGAGLSGCSTALTLADAGFSVNLVGAGEDLDAGNSKMAQGGIVYVQDNLDDEKAFVQDINVAGHHYNFNTAVQFLASHGGAAVQEILIDKLQVPFNTCKSSNIWDLTLEGGHSAPRILHCADYTGKTIMTALHDAIQKHPHISVMTGRYAVDLITTEHHAVSYRYQLRNQCVGAYIFNEQSSKVERYLADYTVLATGGVGDVYLHSTNSEWSVGTGIAMAQRAGVRLANMEFVQFHPTALYDKENKRQLITEALRGEGAILLDSQGEYFMHKYDARKELAPRDIVSRAIVTEMLQTGASHVFLDATQLSCPVIERFPTVYNSCKNIGIDIRYDLIPVVPAAHYFCGGILVDLAGRSTLDNLYAVGECSCTGIHGANRLASTSLLEALLWGVSAGKDIAHLLGASMTIKKDVFDAIPRWENTGDEHNDDPALIAQDWASIRTLMWNYVGIIRTESRLRRAFADLRDLSEHLHDFYRHTPLSPELIRLFHGCQTAYAITQAALRNKTSIGCHYRQ